jgi:thiol-disulfide isomerase/thioredoxin
MKKTILLFVTLFMVNILAKAQTEITKPIEQLGFNKNTVVTHEDGTRYIYDEWSKLMQTGKYKLQPIDYSSDSTAFILTAIDEATEAKLLSTMPRPNESPSFKTGVPFKYVDLTDINGNIIKAGDLKGKVVVFNFWFIACPPCRYEMPDLNRLVNAYLPYKNVVFIAVALDKTEDVERFMKVSPFKFRLVANARYLFSRYNVAQCPTSLVVDQNGIVRFSSVGSGKGAVPYWIKRTIDEIK